MGGGGAEGGAAGVVRRGVQGVGAEGVATDIRAEGDGFVISLLGVSSFGWGLYVFFYEARQSSVNVNIQRLASLRFLALAATVVCVMSGGGGVPIRADDTQEDVLRASDFKAARRDVVLERGKVRRLPGIPTGCVRLS